jgi:hypothetical protein
MVVEISLHNCGKNVHVGYVVIEELNAKQIGDIANESGGLADLVSMGVDGTTVPQAYEWTGDEVYEVQ